MNVFLTEMFTACMGVETAITGADENADKVRFPAVLLHPRAINLLECSSACRKDRSFVYDAAAHCSQEFIIALRSNINSPSYNTRTGVQLGVSRD